MWLPEWHVYWKDADIFRCHDKAIMRRGMVSQFREPQTLHGMNVIYQSIKMPLRNNNGIIAGILGLSRQVQCENNNFVNFTLDRKSTRLNSSHSDRSRMPSSA